MTARDLEVRFPKVMNHIIYGMGFNGAVKGFEGSFTVKGHEAFRIHRYLHAVGYRYIGHKEGAILPSRLFGMDDEVTVFTALGGNSRTACGCYWVVKKGA